MEGQNQHVMKEIRLTAQAVPWSSVVGSSVVVVDSSSGTVVAQVAILGATYAPTRAFQTALAETIARLINEHPEISYPSPLPDWEGRGTG